MLIIISLLIIYAFLLSFCSKFALIIYLFIPICIICCLPMDLLLLLIKLLLREIGPQAVRKSATVFAIPTTMATRKVMLFSFLLMRDWNFVLFFVVFLEVSFFDHILGHYWHLNLLCTLKRSDFTKFIV